MAACAISNKVDQQHWEQREQMYMERFGRYDEKEAQIFPELLAITTEALDANPEQDFLGSLFMLLELGNHWKGQFFTPYNLCRAMADLTVIDVPRRIRQKGFVSVNDCASGAGALLIAFANAAKAKGVNYQQHVLFVGQDVDLTAVAMCYVQLSLLGCPGYVIVANTLTEPVVPPDSPMVWYTPMYFHKVWHWRRLFRELDHLTSTHKHEQEMIAEAPEQLTLF
ncbi:N-6 DNA methylase [Xylanibacillus composti]|uniref:DNA methylase adenine-specific domain-containing protein n=1 Tax=Xylanibacillus composti TaxID=1572762 RepID=A0A8J4GYA6_9BACL|nr:N-6 DNA methylase [Xylanibacillus composti]GIQ67427.1 hypothetical protein XYCOK13_02510 [Xylanibacillus composti]